MVLLLFRLRLSRRSPRSLFCHHLVSLLALFSFFPPPCLFPFTLFSAALTAFSAFSLCLSCLLLCAYLAYFFLLVCFYCPPPLGLGLGLGLFPRPLTCRLAGLSLSSSQALRLRSCHLFNVTLHCFIANFVSFLLCCLAI